MAAVTVPFTGDRIPDGYPSVIKVIKVTTGVATMDVDVGSSSQATYDIVTLPAGAHIVDVGWRVAQVFTNAVTFTIGDTDDGDGWALASDISSDAMAHIKTSREAFLDGLREQLISSAAGDTTANSTCWQVPAYALPGGGYTCSSGGTKTIDITVGGADPATGKLEIYVYYHMAYGQKST
jgi:hypothetical protein